MPGQKIRTLVIEDSSLMRMLLADVLGEGGTIEIIDTASNGKEGFEKTKLLRPDVVISDMVMPEYDGLYAVKKIMKECPTPIILLSGLEKTDKRVFEALGLGAVDFIDKPKKGFSAMKKRGFSLVDMVKYSSQTNLNALLAQKKKVNNHKHTFDPNLRFHILAIGASTGGPGAIERILQNLPENLALPVVIAQHMPDRFLNTFASRLDTASPFTVKIAEKDEPLQPGIIYLVPGHCNTYLERDGARKAVTVKYTEKAFKEFNNPSVDCLFQSVAEVYKEKALAILLSGMGRDGTQGCKALTKNGGFTIAQSEESSVVFGMPKSAIDAGAITQVVTLHEIPGFVVSCL